MAGRSVLAGIVERIGVVVTRALAMVGVADDVIPDEFPPGLAVTLAATSPMVASATKTPISRPPARRAAAPDSLALSGASLLVPFLLVGKDIHSVLRTLPTAESADGSTLPGAALDQQLYIPEPE